MPDTNSTQGFPGQVNDIPETETEAAIAKRLWSDNQLREITDFRQLMDIAKSENAKVVKASDEIGSGFKVLDNKDKLLGIPFMIIEWRFNEGKYIDPTTQEKGDFVSCVVLTRHDEKWILNDGSTGIAKQLRDYTDRTGDQEWMFCEEGLRVSRDYEVTLPDGTTTLGTTYYIA